MNWLENRRDETEMFLNDALEASRRRGSALVDRAYDVLGDMLADELRYTHATGVPHDRAGYLDFVRERLQFDAVRLEVASIGLDQEMAIVCGTLHQTIRRRGEAEPVALVSSVVEVWKRRKGWQLAVFQSTRLPPA